MGLVCASVPFPWFLTARRGSHGLLGLLEPQGKVSWARDLLPRCPTALPLRGPRTRERVPAGCFPSPRRALGSALVLFPVAPGTGISVPAPPWHGQGPCLWARPLPWQVAARSALIGGTVSRGPD